MKARSITSALTVIDVTPVAAQCPPPACPAIFETSRNSYLIVGKLLDPASLPNEVRRKIGDGETVVEVPFVMVEPRRSEA